MLRGKKSNLFHGLFTCFYHRGVKSPEFAGECASPAGWWGASTPAPGSPGDSSGLTPTEWTDDSWQTSLDLEYLTQPITGDNCPEVVLITVNSQLNGSNIWTGCSFISGSDERITARAHKGPICNNSFVPAAKTHPSFYVLIGLLSTALLIVSVSACRSDRCKHFLPPLDFSAGCIWFTFNYLSFLRSLPPTRLGLHVRQFAGLLCWLAEEIGSHLQHGSCLRVHCGSLHFLHPGAHVLLDEVLQLHRAHPGCE